MQIVNDILASVSGPVAAFLKQENVREVCVQQKGQVLVENDKGWDTHDISGITENWALNFKSTLANFTNQSSSSPILSATLPTGERVQIVSSPAVEFPSITIRVPAKTRFSLADLHRLTAFDLVLDKLDYDPVARLTHLVQNHANIVISGGTGSGKTTLTRALIETIPAHERLISIEDARELFLTHPNCVQMTYSRSDKSNNVTARELLESCLRMRPDRILLAEIRGDEAYQYIRSISSGHPGSITSIHATTPQLAINQFMLLFRQSDAGKGMNVEDVRGIIESVVDVVIQMDKRKVTDIMFVQR